MCIQTPSRFAAIAIFVSLSFSADAATVVPITGVHAHNQATNFTGSIADMTNGSGMNGNTINGPVGWPTGEGDPSTWTLTPTNQFGGSSPLYGAEWQGQDILDGEVGDGVATNGKIGWVVFDLGSITTGLDSLYVWHIRENAGRVVSNFNIYIAATPTVTVPTGPTNSTSIDYNFASGGWTSIYTGQSGTQSGLQTFDLNEATARYIGIEIIDNSSTDTKVGFQEIAITAVPEPRAALLGGIGLILLLRRRR